MLPTFMQQCISDQRILIRTAIRLQLDQLGCGRYAEGPFAEWLRDRKNARRIPCRLESCDYVAVRNDAAKDGLWKLRDRRQVIYAKANFGKEAKPEPVIAKINQETLAARPQSLFLRRS
jgi:hypothetical protein